MTLKEKKGTHERTELVTTSLLELLIAAKNKVTNKQADEQTNKQTDKVTSSLLELIVEAKNGAH